METNHARNDEKPILQKPDTSPVRADADAIRICGMLGLCVKAGKAVLGAPLVLQAVRSAQTRRRPQRVFLCSDASVNTCKRVQNACRTYQVSCHILPLTGAQLGQAVGKSGVITTVGVMDAGMAHALYNKMQGCRPPDKRCK